MAGRLNSVAGKWQHIWFHGDLHVVPVADSRPHTIPMCTCNPCAKNAGCNGQAILYSHNASDGRD